MKITDIITDKHRLLLSGTMENRIDPEFFEGWDLDNESTFVLRAISYLASRNQWEAVPKAVEVRLRGMIRCYHLKYQTEFRDAARLLEIWNENVIHYFVFRSAALKFGGYTEDCVPVGHISVFVTAKDREKAVWLALKAGFSENPKIPGLLTYGDCGILVCEGQKCFGRNDPESILAGAETVHVIYQHDRMIDVCLPSPENLLKLCEHQILSDFCYTLDRNQLFYLLWIGAVIKSHSGTDDLSIPEIRPHAGKYMRIGMKLKEMTDQSHGILRFAIKVIRKAVKIHLSHLLMKDRIFLT